jgi:murein DD-endopeptidase MepM/ murein hydrolase activator NlpD
MFSIDKFLSESSRGTLLFGSSRKARIVSLGALFLAVCAFGAAGVAPMAPDPSDLPVKAITQELTLPSLSEQVATLEQREQQQYVYVREEKVRPGDTLAVLLDRLGVHDTAAAAFIKENSSARRVLELKAGKRIQAQTTDDGSLQSISTTLAAGRDAPVKNLVVRREGSGFQAVEVAASMEKRVEMRSGLIKSSLFAATDAAQIPDNIAIQLVDMFSTEIDFGSDLRRGDRFNVVYETFWQDGELIRTGRVLAAEFVNDNKTYKSVWFDEPGSAQGGGYFGFDGKSLKKAFLKSPLEFSRISSGFSMRVHPISGQWKAHKGVDFAAPSGTPIRAAGDGTIEFLGTQNGYGNVIAIKHWNHYSTLYGHMSRFASGIARGSKVSQGDIIGYVGATGWATGPHLHYEFRVNNEPRNPLSIDVPNAQPLMAAQMQRFRLVAADMTHRFALLQGMNAATQLAAR